MQLDYIILGAILSENLPSENQCKKLCNFVRVLPHIFPYTVRAHFDSFDWRRNKRIKLIMRSASYVYAGQTRWRGHLSTVGFLANDHKTLGIVVVFFSRIFKLAFNLSGWAKRTYIRGGVVGGWYISLWHRQADVPTRGNEFQWEEKLWTAESWSRTLSSSQDNAWIELTPHLASRMIRWQLQTRS